MPRMNLTEEEVALIERTRRKNAEDLAYNKGIHQAANVAHDFLESKHVASSIVADVVKLLDALKIPIKL